VPFAKPARIRKRKTGPAEKKKKTSAPGGIKARAERLPAPKEGKSAVGEKAPCSPRRCGDVAGFAAGRKRLPATGEIRRFSYDNKKDLSTAAGKKAFSGPGDRTDVDRKKAHPALRRIKKGTATGFKKRDTPLCTVTERKRP